MLVDAQAHLDDRRIGDPQRLIERAAAAGIRDIVSSGVDPRAQSPLPDRAGEPSCRVWRAYGIHPQAVDPARLDEQLRALNDRLDEAKVVALGEIGLDARPHCPEAAVQEQAFMVQLEIAATRALPVILHCVRRMGRLLELLRNIGPLCGGGVLHGFGGPKEVIMPLSEQGLYISVGGLLTRPLAKRCREAAPHIPDDRLLVESDCPDHPPWGEGTAHSEPRHLLNTVTDLAALRGDSPSAIARLTATNARRLYGIPTP